jgi:Zn-dependent protease with chaperone function
MREKQLLYPATPANVPASVIEPSPAFKRQVSNVMGSIVLFFIVYLLLFALSVALVIGCVYAGFAIITHIASFLGIIAGLGLIGLGIMVFVFMVKFLFAVSRFDRSNSIEITETEQPELFEFIRRITIDTQTPFPKKIYLSPDVNACVFYDSSFWSMFLPIKKNLQVGLGLVNSVNVSEFKAVIAHEFGHFSQRSMKLGSFVYNVNRIIHNMLFENTSYSNALGNWASISDIFALFANITVQIAKGIQQVLRQMYGLINKSYMGLSREMEFHADAVAASVSGSKSLVTALRRVELADAGYNIALQKCDELFKEKKVSANIYQNHKTVLTHLADEYKLSSEHGLPVVSSEFISSNNASRVNFKDQWASHPSTEDREVHLSQLAIEAEILTEPAWALFRDKEQLQTQLTEKIYQHATADKNDLVIIDNAVFETKLHHDINRFCLPDAYHGFYDDRLIEVPVQEDEPGILKAEKSLITFEEIFSVENAALYKRIKSMSADLEVLKAIANKNIRAKSFDFDGKKYGSSEATSIAELVEKELKQQQEDLKTMDQKAISFFMDKADEKGAKGALHAKYRDYFHFRRKANEYLAQMNKMIESLAPVYSGQSISIEEINALVNNLKNIHEPDWKNWLAEWIAAGVYEYSPEERVRVQKFIDSNYVYFSGSSFFETELRELHELCNATWETIHTWLFNKFKEILELQLTFVAIKAVA